MYIGYASLSVCVCLCVCLSLAACPHYCTDPDVTWGMAGCPLVVHYWADLQSVHAFRCYDNIAPNAKCRRVLVLALCLVGFVKLQTRRVARNCCLFYRVQNVQHIFIMTQARSHKYWRYRLPQNFRIRCVNIHRPLCSWLLGFPDSWTPWPIRPYFKLKMQTFHTWAQVLLIYILQAYFSLPRTATADITLYGN